MQTNLKTFIRAAFVLAAVAPSISLAKEDTYPAADFKPQVVYQNAELIKQAVTPEKPAAATQGETHAPDPKYPAAHFEPVIIQKAAVVAEAPRVVEAPHAPDPKYPAAYFNPVVVVPAK